MNYYFVFQNKSFEHERKGGYLWAPKTTESGKRVSHWESMKGVKKGDLILHSVHKKLVAISIVKADCVEAQQPDELKKERLWQDAGYMVYTQYFDLKDSIITSDYKDMILKLQPKVNAPFNRLGKGNTGYLFNCTKELSSYLIEEILKVQRDTNTIQRLKGLKERYFKQEMVYDIQEDIPNEFIAEKPQQYNLDAETYQLEQFDELTNTEKLTLIKSRIGHGVLKKKLLQRECRCKVCGLSDEKFLIASHIKPWSQSNAQERLDIENVLLLCPHHDVVFDRGYITFDEDGTLVISSELSSESRALLNLVEGKKVDVSNKSCHYLRWHRRNLFRQ